MLWKNVQLKTAKSSTSDHHYLGCIPQWHSRWRPPVSWGNPVSRSGWLIASVRWRFCCWHHPPWQSRYSIHLWWQVWDIPATFAFPTGVKRGVGWKLWLRGMPGFTTESENGSIEQKASNPFASSCTGNLCFLWWSRTSAKLLRIWRQKLWMIYMKGKLITWKQGWVLCFQTTSFTTTIGGGNMGKILEQKHHIKERNRRWQEKPTCDDTFEPATPNWSGAKMLHRWWLWRFQVLSSSDGVGVDLTQLTMVMMRATMQNQTANEDEKKGLCLAGGWIVVKSMVYRRTCEMKVASLFSTVRQYICWQTYLCVYLYTVYKVEPAVTVASSLVLVAPYLACCLLLPQWRYL